MIEYIFTYIDGLTSFQQGLLGSAVFAFTSWLARKIYKKIKSSGIQTFHAYSELDVLRHVLHKHYISSTNIHEVSYGASLVLLRSFEWFIKATLTMTFFFAVDSIFQSQWLYVVASWFTFNCLLEAHNWVKDSSREKAVSYIEENKRDELINSMLPESKRTNESS